MANEIDTNLTKQLGLTNTQTNTTGASQQLGQKDFLNLMITQLRNQDPFKPMDSTQFLGQMAQFSTVSGIGAMQKSLDQLTNAMQGNQTLQAASLVDRHVWVTSKEGWLPPSGSLQTRVDAPDGTTDVGVGVYDLHGQRVATLAPDGDAASSFTWDGTLPDGSRAAPGFYELKATGQLGGKATALSTSVAGQVESVSRKGAGQGVQLTVTGVGVVNMDDIRGID